MSGRSRHRRAFWFVTLAIGLVMTIVFAGQSIVFPVSRAASTALGMVSDRPSLAADGRSRAVLTIRRSDGGELTPRQARVSVVEGARRARIESVVAAGDALQVVVRAGILPGPITVETSAEQATAARVHLTSMLDPADTAADGTPDFLKLEDAGDRAAFRRWFTFLAEIQAMLPPEETPREINDCAALVRFAYREALREHDGLWASALRLPALPVGPSVGKYRYPFTPLGAGLFRVRPGAFQSSDLSDGAFAQFADANTLRRLNTHFIARDLRDARPGDLLFYRQLEQDQPFHTMIFLGASLVEPGVHQWVVYHTGASSQSKGELRRVPVEELLAHPEPRWRPVAGNPNFLGVYRWNILRAAD